MNIYDSNVLLFNCCFGNQNILKFAWGLPEGFPSFGLWLQLYFEEIFTVHINGRIPSLNGYCTHLQKRTLSPDWDPSLLPWIWMSYYRSCHFCWPVSRSACYAGSGFSVGYKNQVLQTYCVACRYRMFQTSSTTGSPQAEECSHSSLCCKVN